MKKLWIIVVVVGVLFSVAWAATTVLDRAYLEGLEGVSVAIMIAGDDKCGLTEDELRTITELSLRRNGIKVLTPSERINTSGRPALLVNIVVVGDKDGIIRAASVNVELLQDAYLLRNRDLFYAVSTWVRLHTLLASVNNIDANVKETIKDIVDEFSNDYLTANPIERPTQPKVNEKGGEK